MGLPQELVDYIMDILRDDIRALKACSLTCKALFASARRPIHQTLSVTSRLDKQFLTVEEKKRPDHLLNHREIGLRYLSAMAERGLFRYTRQVHIRKFYWFTPDLLLPQIHHFQSLDRVHTLIIERCYVVAWTTYFNTYFVHFYSTLTSLTLRQPSGPYRLLLQFALQFPNLENLCIEWVQGLMRPDLNAPFVFDKSPPLRGRLRLAGADAVDRWPMDLIRGLRIRMNFRYVELEGFLGTQAQHILDACAHTLEDLTIAPSAICMCQVSFLCLTVAERSINFLLTDRSDLPRVRLTGIMALRRFTLRTSISQMPFVPDPLLEALPTIMSPVFCEFTLEMGILPSNFNRPALEHWGYWGGIDQFLEERFARHGGFKFIIRTGRLYDREIFQRHARETFPLLAGRGCIYFEISRSIDSYWS